MNIIESIRKYFRKQKYNKMSYEELYKYKMVLENKNFFRCGDLHDLTENHKGLTSRDCLIDVISIYDEDWWNYNGVYL